MLVKGVVGEVQRIECWKHSGWNSFTEKSAHAATVEIRTSYWKIAGFVGKKAERLCEAAVAAETDIETRPRAVQLLRNEETSLKPFQNLDNAAKEPNQRVKYLRLSCTRSLDCEKRGTAALSSF